MTAAKKLDPPTPLEAARALTARGWRVFPCEYRGKRPAVGIKWSVAAASAPTDATLALWFGRDPVNVAVAARGSGLVILDDDTGDGMTRLCEAYGKRVPHTYRVRTAKGWHWYFDAPRDVEIGNAPGLLAEFGFDVRGGKGAHKEAGGYVVAAGSVHASGHVYVAEDDSADTIELPWWITELLLVAPPASEGVQGDDPWDNPSRGEHQFTHDQAATYVKRHAIEPLQAALPPPKGRGRNNALNNAAVVVGHFVPEFWSEEWAVERLTELALEVGLERHEIGPTIRSGMRAGMTDPYALVERDPFDSASDSPGHEAGADATERKIVERVEALRIDHLARLRWTAEQRAHRPSIADGVLDDLDAIESPAMLLGALIPEGGVGFLAGRSGAYKSFLAVAWACCIATGRPWLGREEFVVSRPLKTLYVAAEGAAGAAGRIKAWEAATGVSRKGKLLLYPRAIHLNDPAQVGELGEYVAENEIMFLVIDTYHRSAPGTDENSSTDFGLVFEAVAALRDERGCASLFIDHTGAGKNGNPRGTSGKRDDSDYVLSASYPGEEATGDAQRELWVTKLKDEETTGRWPIFLREVDGQKFPVVEIGAVEVSTPFSTMGDDFGEWWQVDRLPEIPEKVADAISREAAKDRNRGLEAARWVWRFMAVVNDPDGLTSAVIAKALEEVPRPRPITRAAVLKALPILERAGVVGRDKTRVWLENSALPEGP